MDAISSRKNENVRYLREIIRDKKVRDREHIFVAEGDHLCGELAELDYKIPLFAYTEKALEKYSDTTKAMLGKAEKSILISEELAEFISDAKSPQGLFAAAEIRLKSIPENAKRVIVLDSVSDPGNVGTIARTAEALGFDGMVTIGDCADIYSPKTLRASMGSLFRFPTVSCFPEELRKVLTGFSVYGAMLDSTALKLGEANFPEKAAFVIGSEARGISPETAEQCDYKLYIPIVKAESLNAAIAAAIIMFQAKP